jgi:hypothetical protein
VFFVNADSKELSVTVGPLESTIGDALAGVDSNGFMGPGRQAKYNGETEARRWIDSK